MITIILLGIIIIILLSATVAPLGSLGWWAGWYGEELSTSSVPGTTEAIAPPIPAHDIESNRKPLASHYIVYLSGIGAFTGSSIPHEEFPFLDALCENIPNSVVITDVFPYSVTNVGLTGERAFAWIWRRIEALRPINPTSMWLYMVVVRNMFQVIVSADRRYGPIYNLGVAKEIWRSLLRHGYRPGKGIPVTLIGTSGGGQISVGSITYLSEVVDVPIQVISLGGVISSDPGLLKAAHLYHLYGANDGTHTLGAKIFPGRWPIAFNSAWNRAQAQGKITMKETGPADHVGKESHFDRNAFVEDGRSYFDITLQEVLLILK
ncbi:MAG: hypothetical protein AAF702_15560 [Chloroflexota bacterium]